MIEQNGGKSNKILNYIYITGWTLGKLQCRGFLTLLLAGHLGIGTQVWGGSKSSNSTQRNPVNQLCCPRVTLPHQVGRGENDGPICVMPWLRAGMAM